MLLSRKILKAGTARQKEDEKETGKGASSVLHRTRMNSVNEQTVRACACLPFGFGLRDFASFFCFPPATSKDKRCSLSLLSKDCLCFSYSQQSRLAGTLAIYGRTTTETCLRWRSCRIQTVACSFLIILASPLCILIGLIPLLQPDLYLMSSRRGPAASADELDSLSSLSCFSQHSSRSRVWCFADNRLGSQ